MSIISKPKKEKLEERLVFLNGEVNRLESIKNESEEYLVILKAKHYKNIDILQSEMLSKQAKVTSVQDKINTLKDEKKFLLISIKTLQEEEEKIHLNIKHADKILEGIQSDIKVKKEEQGSIAEQTNKDRETASQELTGAREMNKEVKDRNNASLEEKQRLSLYDQKIQVREKSLDVKEKNISQEKSKIELERNSIDSDRLTINQELEDLIKNKADISEHGRNLKQRITDATNKEIDLKRREGEIVSMEMDYSTRNDDLKERETRFQLAKSELDLKARLVNIQAKKIKYDDK